ncbi:hypothetical protein ACGFI3_46135 [Nonomuraea wenchangensis]|uniref:hypothetical protein n=1 Tax=Nonomuraea wenchangensis TaxID=568860 RepID=UPI0037116A31
MDEIVGLVEEAGPYVGAALAVYGAGILTRMGEATVEASAAPAASLGRRLLHLVWARRDDRGRAALEQAVEDAAAEPEDAEATAALRQQLKRALREDAELRDQIAALLPPAAGATTITASGQRAIAAHSIGIAVTGDNNTVHG